MNLAQAALCLNCNGLMHFTARRCQWCGSPHLYLLARWLEPTWVDAQAENSR